MKKRILAILLAVAMIVCMIPLGTMTAFAATTYTANSTQSLTDAISKASPGDTIKLTGNTTAGNIWIEKNITLDLNGYSMSGSSYNGTVCVQNATVTIKNSSSTRSTISGTGNNGSMLIYESGAVHLEGAITFSNAVYANSGCTLYVDDTNIAFSSTKPNNIKWYQYSVGTSDELSHAIALAPTNGTAATITLTADVSGEHWIENGKNITLNLNGHNLSATSGYGTIVANKSNLNITNTSATTSTIYGAGTSWGSLGGYASPCSIHVDGNVKLANNVMLNNNCYLYVDSPQVGTPPFYNNS